jgi:hypothetical protein
MSDISSAGITRRTPGYGKTCRKDVLRRVDIPVVPGAATRARSAPGGKARLSEQTPARRAGPGGREPAVDHDQFPPLPLALVLKLAAEFTPAAVRDRLGEGAVADHVLHGQVLYHDHVMVADQARRCGAGNRPGWRGPCGAHGPPSPWPRPGSRSRAGSGPGAAGSGQGSGSCAPGAGRIQSMPPILGHRERNDLLPY